MIGLVKGYATLAWLSFKARRLKRRRQRLMAENDDLRAELARLLLAEKDRG